MMLLEIIRLKTKMSS